jgi:hypothetical protein
MASGTAGGRIAPGVGANLIGQHAQDRNQDATVYVGNLDSQVTIVAYSYHQNCAVCAVNGHVMTGPPHPVYASGPRSQCQDR